jgi:hypothetical protein
LIEALKKQIPTIVLGFEKWKKKHRYGKRWIVEGVFSAVKRCYGETLRASSINGLIKEVGIVRTILIVSLRRFLNSAIHHVPI